MKQAISFLATWICVARYTLMLNMPETVPKSIIFNGFLADLCLS